MKLSEIIHEVWKDEEMKRLQIRKTDVEAVIKTTLKVISKAIVKEGIVKLHGFFTLKTKEVKGRRIMNLHTQEHMYTKDYTKLTIEPSQNLKDELKNKK